MWNEESSLTVNHWRSFLNEQELPPEVDEDPIEKLTQPAPVAAGPPTTSPPTTSLPAKPTADDYHKHPELVERDYPECIRRPEACQARPPHLQPEIYKKPVILSKDDIPTRLDIDSSHIIWRWADGSYQLYPDDFSISGPSIPYDSRDIRDVHDISIPTVKPLTNNFLELINRAGGWVKVESVPGVKVARNSWSYGSVATKLILTAMGTLKDAETYPFLVRDVSFLYDSGDKVSIGVESGGHLSHKKGVDVDLSIPLKPSVNQLGQSVTRNGNSFLAHGSINPSHLDLARAFAVLQHNAPHSEKIFLWRGHRIALSAYADTLINNGDLTRAEKRNIFKKISDGCARGVRRCKDHDNHFHIRYHKKYALAPYNKRFAPWYNVAGSPKETAKIKRALKILSQLPLRSYIDSKGRRPTAQQRKSIQRLLDLPPEIIDAYKKENERRRKFGIKEFKIIEKFLKEYKFKELINLLTEQKTKEKLVEQPQGPPMDPAAQRLEMQKQIIQMQLGPMITQAADLMFTLNSLEDPAADNQARMYADRIQGEIRDLLSGKREPMESAQRFGPLVDEMGRKLQKFMS